MKEKVHWDWLTWFFCVLTVLWVSVCVVSCNDIHAKANHALMVVDSAPLQVTVRTPDGQRLNVASSYPKVKAGWYVTLSQNSEGVWEIDEYWPQDPRE
jgi:hypothetical protein